MAAISIIGLESMITSTLEADCGQVEKAVSDGIGQSLGTSSGGGNKPTKQPAKQRHQYCLPSDEIHAASNKVGSTLTDTLSESHRADRTVVAVP